MAAIALGSKITAAVHLTVVRAWLSILATVIVTSGATTRSVILMEAIAPVSRLMWAVHLQDLFVPLTKLPIERATLAATTRNASGMTALVRAVRRAGNCPGLVLEHRLRCCIFFPPDELCLGPYEVGG